MVLTLQGYRQPAWINVPGCYRTKRSLNTAGGVSCGGAATTESFLYIWIPAAELKKLPVGGLWTASLRMTSWRAGGPNNTTAWNADITLNVIDPSNIDIYFPEFSFATPRIALKLHPTGSPTGRVTAQDITMLDMCLYDGYNANSTQYEIVLHDSLQAHEGRANSDFSIYRVGGEIGPERDRIDYHVKMLDAHTGGMLDVHNNQLIIRSDIDREHVRPVRLPTVPTPVLCVPASLELIVKRFNVQDKNAGYYSGTLTVMFTPTTPTVD
ncbi:CblD-like pilus biogenesis initiator [Enterobacillus tribolii]|uniref:CblD-like pilus biogenesis initiator n=1 Tax=Enterobacillus tribolii TaxID=1487935 RepID=A0A370R3M3_9GAMM|nr:CblD-like pilus biogenesis initiator [Enterobacillus tribolii]